MVHGFFCGDMEIAEGRRKRIEMGRDTEIDRCLFLEFDKKISKRRRYEFSKLR